LADVFISYTRADRPIADALARALARIGVDVWYDRQLSTASEWRAETTKQLARARLVLALWSPRALQSTWVKAEAELADSRGALLSALIAPCDIPAPFHLSAPVDLCDWRPDENDIAFWRLIDAISELIRDTKLRDYALQELYRTGGVARPHIQSFDFVALMRLCENLRDDVRAFDPDVLIAPDARAGFWAEMLFDWLQRRTPVLVGDRAAPPGPSFTGFGGFALPATLELCPRDARLLFVNDRTADYEDETAFLEGCAARGFPTENLLCLTLVAQRATPHARCISGDQSEASELAFFYDVAAPDWRA